MQASLSWRSRCGKGGTSVAEERAPNSWEYRALNRSEESRFGKVTIKESAEYAARESYLA